MLTYRVTYNDCSECFAATHLLEELDTAIAALGKRMYQSKIYLLKRNISRRKLRTLLYYKEVVQKLIYNESYYEAISYQEISSRVKVLINGLR